MQNNSTETALVLSHVSAQFPDEEGRRSLALEDISFAVPKGSFVSIIGPSGAGKSTLFRLILGLMPELSGKIERRFSRAAMVFQNYALFPWLNVVENVSFGLRMRGVSLAEQRRIAREKLKEVELENIDAFYPSQLSGGQKQRVGLARALAVAPDFLIMDEPFSNLDTITANDLKEDLLRLWQNYGMTILMVNHIIPDAVELSDQIILLAAHPGRVEEKRSISLPRPRDTRAPQFFKEVDELTERIRSVS